MSQPARRPGDEDDDDRTTAGYNSQEELVPPEPVVFVPSTPPQQIRKIKQAKRKFASDEEGEDEGILLQNNVVSQRRGRKKPKPNNEADAGVDLITRSQRTVLPSTPLRDKGEMRQSQLLRHNFGSGDSDSSSDSEQLFLPIMNRLNSFKSENKSLKRRLAELESLLKEKDDAITKQHNKLENLEKTNAFLSGRMEDFSRSTPRAVGQGCEKASSVISTSQKPLLCHGCKITLF
ncbi:hypothetical protein BDR26DRAFT_853608 [Obelidium mucronatum]|nr:hypothetical protein BDR26DRAFT_853608 [Obelidium mucronatum]